MITISDVFQTFTETQKEAIYELAGDAALNGKYDHGLYYRTQFGMSENQKDVIDFLIRMSLKAFKKGKEKTPKEDCLFVGFDSNGTDEPCLVVMRKRLNGSVEVVNFLYGETAINIYKTLISN